LGFNEPVSAQAFPTWVLTNQFPLVKAQTGTGQTDFRTAFPNWAEGVRKENGSIPKHAAVFFS